MKEEQYKHLFLTGNIRVGKSTIIRRFLEMTGLRPEELGGFRTEICMEKDGSSSVHLVSPAGSEDLDRENRIMIRPPRIRELGGYPEVFPEVFDARGVELLRTEGSEKLVLMDELGFAEQGASRFRNRVLEILDGPVPVLGVLKQWPGDFLNRVSAHPRVSVVRVTEENREEIIALMAYVWNLRRRNDETGKKKMAAGGYSSAADSS